jgi:transposase InsO family protein
VIFAAIADWAERDEYPVAFMCEKLGVSRSGYYKWRHAGESSRARQNRELTQIIQAVFEPGNRPGVRRVRAELRARGWRVSHQRVWALMRRAGLVGRHRKAYKKTTVQSDRPVPAPDLVGRDFTAGKPNQKWVGDITYVKTWRGWAYLAVVIDLYSRKLVGWTVADHMRSSLVIDALTHALRARWPPGKVLFHSDRGAQYTSVEFAEFCRTHGVTRSLGRTGSCFDNAVAESFNATYKKELVHTRPWPSVEALRKATFEWVERHYNRNRRHSTLGYLTIEEYELGYRHLDQLAA